MASHHQAQLLLGVDHYLRIDDETADKYPLDNVERCRPLQERGAQKSRETSGRVKTLFGI
jgi:hypothetical protein